jgi:hypothetical protein
MGRRSHGPDSRGNHVLRDDDVVRKVLGDLTAAGVDTDEATIRQSLTDKTVDARRQLMGS